MGEIKLFQQNETENNWDGLSQIHNLYASQANWAFDDDQASTVDVDATSRVKFLFESQNSLRAALRDAIDEGEGKTIYDEDGTEMLTYRSDGAAEEEGDKQTLEKINEEEKQEEETSSGEEDSSEDDDENEQGSSNT